MSAAKERGSEVRRAGRLPPARSCTAQRVAAEPGIDEVIAQVQPTDKAATVAEVQQQGREVAMVGDGVKDAPALAHADCAYVALPEPRDDRGRCRRGRDDRWRPPSASAHTGRVAVRDVELIGRAQQAGSCCQAYAPAVQGAGDPSDRASSEITAHMEVASCSARTTENARELD